MDEADNLHERRLEGLRHSLGPLVVSALSDPDVVEVMLNDDGRLWVERRGVMQPIGEIAVADSMTLVRQVASALGETITKANPIVEGELPLDGSRFEALTSPIVEMPVFAIRKKAGRVFTLDDYIRQGVLDPDLSAEVEVKAWNAGRRPQTGFEVAELLRLGISERQNIMVVGGTGTGKTTFCNALLYDLALIDPDSRVILMEDTRELQCSMQNKVMLRSNEHVSMQRLLRATMRLRPDRICVGEVRDGAALALLKAWNTGHPGGVATVHASSASKGLTRVNQLIQEVSAHPQLGLVGESINMVVYIERVPGGRRIKEILRVHGYDEGKRRFEVERYL